MKTDESAKTVLIVEDDRLSRKILAKYVGDLGYEVQESDNGLSALAIAGTGTIDIVLLDLGLPDIDGFEVLRRIKADKMLQDIPVVIVSGKEDSESIIRCLTLKADDYLVKPVDPVMLGTRFREIIGNAQVTRERKPHFVTSLAQTGAGIQFLVASLLISVLPTLALVYILLAPTFNFPLSRTSTHWILGMIILLVVSGYLLLMKYPLSIMRLRRYLSLLAKGDFSGEIKLDRDEDDLKAISNYISSIVKQTQDRIRTIEEQTKTLIDEESRRVMIESLGAACHHIGQPATVINTYLSMMRKRESQPEMQAMIAECQKASDDLANVLEKLTAVTQYQSETYLAAGGNGPPRTDERILKING